MRQVIVARLYAHLRDHYFINLSDEFPSEEQASLHQIDSILAFKSDPQLDELRAALERLQDGTFGYCLGCKKQMDSELMDEDPTGRFCERCEKTYSRVVVSYQGSALPA